MSQRGSSWPVPQAPRRSRNTLQASHIPCDYSLPGDQKLEDGQFITSEVLYQLSYVGAGPDASAERDLRGASLCLESSASPRRL
jgi:hypothetical protein